MGLTTQRTTLLALVRGGPCPSFKGEEASAHLAAAHTYVLAQGCEGPCGLPGATPPMMLPRTWMPSSIYLSIYLSIYVCIIPHRG